MKSARWTTQNVPDQSGRRVVITGANSGVGLESARALLSAGAEVVLAVRNRAKGEAAAADLPGSPEVRVLDVADLDSVRTFAADIGPVDVLINNAGVLGVPFGRSPDGVELHFATNHLGPFALTNLMLPKVRDRIVTVTSTAHRSGRIDLSDLGWSRRTYQPFAAYGQSKLANLLFVWELSRRLTEAGSRVRAVAAHPGSTATGITHHTGSAWKTFVGKHGHKLVGMKPAQGALPTLYAATVDLPGNSFIGPDGLAELRGWPVVVGRSARACDPEVAKALWSASEELSNVTFSL